LLFFVHSRKAHYFEEDLKGEKMKKEMRRSSIESQMGHNTDGSKAADKPDTSVCGHHDNEVIPKANLRSLPLKSKTPSPRRTGK
jgi:hypothetical protein